MARSRGASDDYVATDQSGRTATSTRQVMIEPAMEVASASFPDTASATTATSTAQ